MIKRTTCKTSYQKAVVAIICSSTVLIIASLFYLSLRKRKVFRRNGGNNPDLDRTVNLTFGKTFRTA
jgi:hypothetical protein